MLIFSSANKSWLDFIISNRRGIKPHTYDCVKGVVADDTLYETFSLYEAGILTVEETVKRLKVHKLFDQVSFHTPLAVNMLHFAKALEI